MTIAGALKYLGIGRDTSAATISGALAEGSRRDAEVTRTRGLVRIIQSLTQQIVMSSARESKWREDYIERCHELQEASQMHGSGPWLREGDRGLTNNPGAKLLGVRETIGSASANGAFGDLELALSNAEWRREINFSWLEFSRWGIQQIILISRLYYIKNPIIRRLIDVDAYYVFGRGVEVSSPDETANEVLHEFFERNQAVLGQVALSEHQKRTNYDGNLFFCFYKDEINTGETNIRLLDATEMQDIITDPEDVTVEQFFRRSWAKRTFDPATGVTSTNIEQMWYPALNYNPTEKPKTINMIPVDWDHPVLHKKFGAVGQWIFGCPVIYPALDWAKAARRFLEACANVKQALSQIGMTITTKGGQQAMEGIKQQLQTTVGPNGPAGLWDTNPPPVDGSLFVSGPGTVLAAFKSSGAGGDPNEVKQFVNMACMVVGVPPTFLGDLDTSNLATATTLDRPTELGFMHKQEAWKELLTEIGVYVLSVSGSSANGKIRESIDKRKLEFKDVTIREAKKVRRSDGTTVYEAKEPTPNVIEVKCDFPSIREGDNPAMISALVQAMTLGNAQGEVVGIDEKSGVRRLFELVGIQDSDELVEEMYPEGEYDPDRAEVLAAKKDLTLNPPPHPPVAGPVPGKPGKPSKPVVKEAAFRVMEALAEFVK